VSSCLSQGSSYVLCFDTNGCKQAGEARISSELLRHRRTLTSPGSGARGDPVTEERRDCRHRVSEAWWKCSVAEPRGQRAANVMSRLTEDAMEEQRCTAQLLGTEQTGSHAIRRHARLWSNRHSLTKPVCMFVMATLYLYILKGNTQQRNWPFD
jgi:hypothetical protein